MIDGPIQVIYGLRCLWKGESRNSHSVLYWCGTESFTIVELLGHR